MKADQKVCDEAMRGKSVNLYLRDGKPNGIVKCTLANWTGLTYRIPRTMLNEAEAIDALNQTGVYFLFGQGDFADSESGLGAMEGIVYVGQAGLRKNGKGILGRLKEHVREPKEEWWTTAVAFTSSNDFFGPTEMNYLEHRFWQMATEAGRYKVMNANDPNPGNVTEEKESELEEYIQNAQVVMGILGYLVFEPLAEPIGGHTHVQHGESSLHFKSSRADARGMRTSEGFVVLRGSRISPIMTKKCANSARKYRERYADAIDGNHVLTADLLFSSPSAAAAFVGGASLSGNKVWKTADGRNLGELEAD